MGWRVLLLKEKTMQTATLNQYHNAYNNTVDWAFFDLMKSTAEIHANAHQLTSDCIHQIEVAVNSLKAIIESNKSF